MLARLFELCLDNFDKTEIHFCGIKTVSIDQITRKSLNIEALGIPIKSGRHT